MSESAGCPVRLPVPLMLARPIRVLPDAPGAVYEAKLDGVRAVYGAGRLWSRHRKQLHVPEVIAAARGLGDGVVLDGELVVFAAAGRCDFPGRVPAAALPRPARRHLRRLRPACRRRPGPARAALPAPPPAADRPACPPGPAPAAHADHRRRRRGRRLVRQPAGRRAGHQAGRGPLPAGPRPARVAEAAFCSGVWVWQDWGQGAHLVVRRLLVRDTCRASPSRLERSWAGRATSMHSGWRGRFFGVATTAGATG